MSQIFDGDEQSSGASSGGEEPTRNRPPRPGLAPHAPAQSVDSSGDDRGWDEPPRRRRGGGRIALVVLLLVGAVIVGGGYLAYRKVESHFATSPDYSGPGVGRVSVEVTQGETVADIGRELRKLGVVKSVDSFISAANGNPKSNGIQVGFYELKRQMASADALAVLVDPANLVQASVTIPEGYRLKQIVAAVASHSKITKAAMNKAIKKAGSLGLPVAAKGNPEGWLFPATYTVAPNMTADDLVSRMIATTKSTLTSLGVKATGNIHGLTEEQVLTLASILEYEASRAQDFPKVAQAIYNRLRIGMPLQSDATVAYANNLTGTLYTTDAQRALDSPYNTYKNTGLPPGPIGAPGEVTIKAALHPTPGPWLFWVVVNLRTGKTLYATTYAQHLLNVAKFQAYCQTSSAC